MEVALEHALIEEHVAHGLRDDNVHLLGEGDLFHLPRDDDDALGEVVTLHQDLWAGGPPSTCSLSSTLTLAAISHSTSSPSGPSLL